MLLDTSRESTKMWQIDGCLRVSRILVNKASGDSVLQVLGNKARKKLPNRPGFTHVQRGALSLRGLCRALFEGSAGVHGILQTRTFTEIFGGHWSI